MPSNSFRLVFTFAFCASVAPLLAQKATDATFVFTDDVHVSFNGNNDEEGITWEGGGPFQFLLIGNETAANITLSASHDGCIASPFTATKDLCNQIQHIRKLNYLPDNIWSKSGFSQAGHSRTLSSAGQRVATPQGVLIGGDLTDCGAGSDDSGCDNGNYDGATGAQLLAFTNLYDNTVPKTIAFSALNFLPGLNKPDSVLPLRYPIYPGLGNHDLGFSDSSAMQAYIAEWNPSSNTHPVTNSNGDYYTYSFDFGDIHIVNVGVFPGSDNGSNYDFNQDSMNWLANDLATYASDGRPVVIYAHFGFDTSISLTKSWWFDSNRKAGYDQLWGVIQNYNVVGYFTGHNHGQSNPLSVSQTLGSMPIDAFQPGAAFYQDFAVVRVNGHNMDVMFTQDADDFDNTRTTVNLNPAFTKQLVPAPTPTCTGADIPGDAVLAAFSRTGETYELGVTTFGEYHLRTVTNCAFHELVAGVLAGPAPKYLTTYTGVGGTHALALYDGVLDDYLVSTGTHPGLTLKWEKPVQPSAVAWMSFAYGGESYLMLDFDPAIHPLVYKITSSGPVLAGTLSTPTLASASLIPYSYKEDGRVIPAFIRVSMLGASFYRLEPIGEAGFEDEPLSASIQSWTANGHAVEARGIAGPPQILVATDPCIGSANPLTCALSNNDTPFSIRTLLPDQSGTDISWHGWRTGLPVNAQSIFQVGTSQGKAIFGAYNAIGFYSQFELSEGE